MSIEKCKNNDEDQLQSWGWTSDDHLWLEVQLADLMRKLSLVIKGSLIIFIIAVLQAPIICGSQPRPGSQPTSPLGVKFLSRGVNLRRGAKDAFISACCFFLQTLRGHFLPEAVSWKLSSLILSQVFQEYYLPCKQSGLVLSCAILTAFPRIVFPRVKNGQNYFNLIHEK